MNLRSLKRPTLALAIACLPFTPRAFAETKGADMDYGPFLQYSVLKPQSAESNPAKPKPAPGKNANNNRNNSNKDSAGPAKKKELEAAKPPPWKAGDLLATKGVVIKLPGEAAICFDTDTCRYAGAWTGGWLDISKCNLTHVQGPLPVIAKGSLIYSAIDGPGWAKNGVFDDTRHPNTDNRSPGGEGPLPRDWAHYKGLYRDGDKVVLSYTVGGVEVLDMPSAITGDAAQRLTRSIEVGTHDRELSMMVCGLDGAHANVSADGHFATLKGSGGDTATATCIRLSYAAPGDKLAVEANAVVVHIASGGERLLNVTTTRVPISSVPALAAEVDPAASRVSLREFTRGGPALWPQVIESNGSLSSDASAPYVVDTAGLPNENPWKSWIKIGGFDFFADGRCAFSTMNGDVWVSAAPLTADLAKTSWKRFAAGLYEPLGLKIVEDKIYVLGRDQITLLHDLNNDGEADFYENFNNDAVSDANYHSFHYDLQTDKEGNFYYAVTGNQMPIAKPDSACVIKVSKYGDKAEVISSGLRAANGLGVGPNDEISVSDNQGHWVPASPIFMVKPGAFFGYHGDPRRVTSSEFAADVVKRPHDDAPLCWIPYKWDNSSGGEVWAPKDFGPLSGHMLHLSYGMSAMFEILGEQVNGTWQGGAVPLGLKFESGVMRGRVNPADGTVWVGGLRGWQTNAGKDACLQRIRYTKKPFNLPTEMHVTDKGIKLSFPVELQAESAGDPGAYSIEVWTFHRTETYGSDDFKISDPKTKGRDQLDVKSVELSADKRSVLIKIDNLKPVPEFILTAHVNAADGTPIKAQVGGTINFIGN